MMEFLLQREKDAQYVKVRIGGINDFWNNVAVKGYVSSVNGANWNLEGGEHAVRGVDLNRCVVKQIEFFTEDYDRKPDREPSIEISDALTGHVYYQGWFDAFFDFGCEDQPVDTYRPNGGPSEIYDNGQFRTELFRNNHGLHREDGPAYTTIDLSDGFVVTELWSLNGEDHRTHGMAYRHHSAHTREPLSEYYAQHGEILETPSADFDKPEI